jgi:hypothetical protein
VSYLRTALGDGRYSVEAEPVSRIGDAHGRLTVIRTVQSFDQTADRLQALHTLRPYTVTGTSDQLQPSVLTEK